MCSIEPVVPPSKRCPACGKSKRVDEFCRNRRSPDGRACYCKPCHNAKGRASRQRQGGSRHYHLRDRYGIGADQVAALIESQGGICAICCKEPALQVDHDHKSGLVQAALCDGCNGSLGAFNEDADTIRPRHRVPGAVELEHRPPVVTKRCPRCRTTKAVAEFPRNRATRDGLATYCKPCHNEKMREISDRLYGGHANYLRRKRYGIDSSEVDALLASQGGVCAICGAANPTHVDHSHATGEVRGILCFSCNRGLGKVNDDVEVLRAMIAYLRG